jgi:hypothetical protein
LTAPTLSTALLRRDHDVVVATAWDDEQQREQWSCPVFDDT